MRLVEQCLLLFLSTATSPETASPEVPCSWRTCPVSIIIFNYLWIACQLNLGAKLFVLKGPALCNDTYPYRLASVVSTTELCISQFGIGWGAEASLSARPDQTRRARGLGLILADRPRFANPDQTRPDASLGQGCKIKT